MVPVCHGIPVRHCGKAGREQHDIACGFRDFPAVRIHKRFCPVRRRRKQLRVADIIRLNVIILPADTGIIIVKRVLPIAAANPQHALRRFSDFRRHDIPHFGLKQDIAVRVINRISHGKRAFVRRDPYRLSGTGRCNDLLRFQVDEVSVPQCHIIRRKSADCNISIELHTIISVRGELFAIAAENRIFPIAREQEIRIALKKRRLRLLKHVFDCAELIQRSPLVRIQPKRLRLRVPVRRVFPESEQLPGIGHFFPFRLRRERRTQQQRGQRQAQQLVYLYFHRVLSLMYFYLNVFP